MLDLNEIAMFVQVVQAGSFAEAARRLSMPPNTLSRQVLQLENHLGVRLLQRSTRKLNLTDAGRALYGRSAAQVEELLQAAQQLTETQQEPSGLVRVAVPADFFDFFQLDWVAEFLREHPAVQLDFVLSDGRADLISEGIDVAFRGGELPDSSLVARRLSTNHTGLVASPAYLALRGTPAQLEDLSHHACIRASKTVGRGLWRLEGPQGPEQVEVTGSFSANTAQAQLKAAVAGLGIALLPMTIATQNLRAGTLCEVLPHYRQSNGGLYVVYPSRKQVPRGVTAFVDAVVQRLDLR